MRAAILLLVAIALGGCSMFGGPAPVYGCWCGQNQPPPGTDPEPIDSWDRACRAHDRCYERRGYNNRSCDIAFLRDLERAAQRERGLVPGQMQAAYSYFLSRLYGTIYVQGFMSPRDLASYVTSGDCPS